MQQTKFIHYKPIARRHMLQESCVSHGESTYSVKLTHTMREEEAEMMTEAVLKNDFPKAREHAVRLKEGYRLETGQLFKFIENGEAGYYDSRGYLITSRPLSRIELAKKETTA